MGTKAFVLSPPFLRSAFNYDMNQASDESGLKCEDVSLAVQDQRDEVDINTIVRRFGLTGELPSDLRLPSYGDFEGISDYHAAMSAVAMANEAFDRLPAELRNKFQNDPAAFVDFCSDEANRGELRKMGLLSPAAIAEMEEKERLAREAAEAADLAKAQAAAQAADLPKVVPGKPA